MVLYRTNDYDHESYSTNIKDVLFYEFYEKCNQDLLENVVTLIEDRSDSYLIKHNLSQAIDAYDKEIIMKYVNMIVDILNKQHNKNFTVGLWLYPLENVKNYYEFQGIDPLIYGYDTSDILLISYPNEGSLYIYENMPKEAREV